MNLSEKLAAANRVVEEQRAAEAERIHPPPPVWLPALAGVAALALVIYAGTFAALIAIVLAFAAGLWHCQCGHDAEHRKVMRWMIRLLLDPTLTGRKDPPSPRN